MPEALIVSQVLLWTITLALAVLVVALMRQIGVLHERIAPMGALTLDRGPKEGEAAPQFTLSDLAGRPVEIGGANLDGQSTLLFFLSPTCPVCKKLLPIIKSIARSESSWLRILLASDGERTEHERFVRAQRLDGFAYVLSADLGMTYRIGKLPYAVLIDDRGTIRAKGLINSREHLESLMEAKRTGFSSIQEYLRSANGGAGADRPAPSEEKGAQ